MRHWPRPNSWSSSVATAILRAAELVVPLGVPLLGVNLGHVGFLAGSHDVHKLVKRSDHSSRGGSARSPWMSPPRRRPALVLVRGRAGNP